MQEFIAKGPGGKHIPGEIIREMAKYKPEALDIYEVSERVRTQLPCHGEGDLLPNRGLQLSMDGEGGKAANFLPRPSPPRSKPIAPSCAPQYLEMGSGAGIRREEGIQRY